MYKGILLAGGAGTRLYPLTSVASKQLLPVYDKPMIYYPLSTLMLFEIKDILIISTTKDIPNIRQLLGDGTRMGIHLSYKVQNTPNGIAEALILGEEFIGQDDICLILGDNIFYMGDQIGHFTGTINNNPGAVICTYHVPDPQRFGVAQIAKNGMVTSLEEKPKIPKSNLAVTGLYFYKNDAVDKALRLKPSARGELEITDLNLEYLKEGRLNAFRMVRGTAWLDAGTPDSLIDAALFVQMIEKRQGLKISCIEEIALNRGFISDQQFEKLVSSYKGQGNYKLYLERVLCERKRSE
ncbi:MAG: glucose-1-phosphate thymidylyltransferase RfbA [Alphaproteobacteria bacterium]|nr:glucose-1-phosphate thymidylyltransferase RfbA [Alphaproteobacteria bacterium]